MRKITEEQFFDEFKPVTNHIDNNASWNGCAFETYGEEEAFVKSQPVEKVWTILSCDGKEYISQGFHHVNRFGYFVTEVASTEDVEVEMEEMWYVRDIDELIEEVSEWDEDIDVETLTNHWQSMTREQVANLATEALGRTVRYVEEHDIFEVSDNPPAALTVEEAALNVLKVWNRSKGHRNLLKGKYIAMFGYEAFETAFIKAQKDNPDHHNW